MPDTAVKKAINWNRAILLATAIMTATVNSRLSLKLQHVLRYVNDPPPTYRRTDTVASAGVTVRF